MASKDVLQSLKKLISTGEYQDALVICKDSLRENPGIFEYNLFAGKCACELNHYEESERFYKSAQAAKPSALQPFHGLVQLYRRNGAYDQQAAALRHILSHSSADTDSVHSTRIELANALLNSDQDEEAWQVIVAIEDGLQHAVGLSETVELPHDVAVLKADCQMKLDESEYNSRLRKTLAEAHRGANGTTRTEDDDVLTQRVAAKWAEELLARSDDAIHALVAASGASPVFTKYHLEILKRTMALICGAPAGSGERHERRAAALQMCVDIVERGGCTSAEPYELALRLLEVEEEVAAHTATGVHSTTGDTADARTLGTRLPSNAMHLPSLPSLDNLGTMGDHAASSAGLPPTPALQTPGSAPHAAAFHPGSSAPFPGAGPRLGTSATAPQHSSPAPAGSNLDRLLAGMPLKSSNSTGGLAEDEHGSGVPATPTRGVRVTAPTVSFGPTDLGSIGSLSSTPRHPLHGGGGVSGGGGLIAQALGGQRRESFTRLPAIGGGDSASGDGAGAEGDDVSQGGRTTGMSIGSAAGTWAGGGNARGLVRFASRSRDDYGDHEVIPVVGSYELRSLSRSHAAAASAAATLHPSHRTSTDHMHAHMPGGVNAVYPPDLVAPDNLSLSSGAGGSLMGRPHCVGSIGRGLGAISLARRASFGSSEAFGASAMSIAGSDDDTASQARAALPPLASLPRISRDDSHAGALAHPNGSTPAAHTPSASHHHGSHPHFTPRSPAISRAPSMMSRMSGSFIAPTRFVPGAEEEAVPVGQLGLLEDMERFAARLVHLAPDNPAGQAHLAMALLRRAPELEQSVQQQQRPRIIHMLRNALYRGVPTAAGWLCLAELCRKEGLAAEALSAARQGLQYVSERARHSRERMTQAGLALRLEAAQALLALGRCDEAADAFALLKEWTSEGEITFPYVAGIMPVSIRQQAARGLAQVAVARGDRGAAKRQYERLLGKALRGLGPSEHWAHAEYAALLAEDGDTAGALHHLHAAIDVAALSDLPVDPADVAGYHFQVGRVLWEKAGGPNAEEQATAYDAFLHAASLGGPAQAAAFTYLGHFFRVARAEEMKARKCYRRALELDPLQAAAGAGLCDLLHDSNSEDLVHGVCTEILEACPSAEWARRRLGQHHLWTERPRDAIRELQAALRMDSDVAETWEALGAAYERLGRLTAALKAYERAAEVDPSRVFALAQAAAISSVMGDTETALATLKRALALEPNNPAVLLCETQTRCQLAAVYTSLGASALAAESLRLGAASATKAVRANGTLEATWKSLGDCRIRQAQLPAATQPPVAAVLRGELDAAPGGPAAVLLESHRGRLDAARAAQRAYAAAVHLNPMRPASWSDLALTQHQIGALGAEHPAVRGGAAAPAARSTAERVLLAALRLAPDVAGLWSALGSVHSTAAKREYALRRAAQLDPADAMIWLKLGRLYHAHNLPGKVTACYDAARSADPKLAAVWEAMSTFEATRAPEATLNTAIGQEAHGLAKHALHLHGGAESALMFAYGSLQDASAPRNGALMGAAHSAVAAQPLNAAAYHTLALTMEAGGSPAAAVAALRAARALRAAARAEPAAATVVPGAPLVAATWRGFDVDECMSLDLARALTAAGEYGEACALYVELDTEARPLKNAYALLAYALARGGGTSLDPKLQQRAMDAAMSAEEVADVAAAAVRGAASASAGNGGYAAAAAAAEWAAPRLQEWGDGGEAARAAARGTVAAHLGALSSAALGDAPADYTAARAAATAAVYRTRAPADEKTEVGERDMLERAAADIEVCAAVHAADARAARRAAMRAVHVCPWSSIHRDLAVCVASADTSAPVHAARIAPVNRVSPGAPQDDAIASAAVDAVAKVHLQHAGLPALCTDSAGAAGQLSEGIRAAKASLLLDPRCGRSYVTLGALLAQRAVMCDGEGAEGAARACMHAVHVLTPAGTGGDGQGRETSAALLVHALVACSIAESARAEGSGEGSAQQNTADVPEQQVPGSGGLATSAADPAHWRADEALETAQRALQEAERSGADAALRGACLRQVARCHRLLGNAAAAETALRHAADTGDTACSILLAQHLVAGGRAAEVAKPATPAAEACVEWLGARKVAEVETACMLGDLERAKAAVSCLPEGGRGARVGSALVAVAALTQVHAGGGSDAAATKQQLSQVRRFGQVALGQCQHADVALVAALALAESEALRAKPEGQARWAGAAATAAARLRGVSGEEVSGGASCTSAAAGEAAAAVGLNAQVRMVRDANA